MSKTFLFAGGGSGGHISPALAVAERVGELDPSARCVFVCSPRPVDRMMLSEAKVSYEALPGSPFSMRPTKLIRFISDFRRSRRAAQAVIRRRCVDRVVTLGGFMAAPVVAAAVKTRAPVTLINLDIPPGKANRWIARRCEQVLSAVDIPWRPDFAQHIVGVPVRKKAMAPGPARSCRQKLGLELSRPTLLVTGASQGAASLNGMIKMLAHTERSMFENWQVLHLAGETQADEVRAAYQEAGIAASVRPFLHHMGLAWGAADLALSRAGANSVAEAWANTVPTVFLPYPYHRDRHQEHNARRMVRVGGALIETDHVEPNRNAAGAGTTLRALMRDHSRREAMRANLRSNPAPDAARTIARMLLA